MTAFAVHHYGLAGWKPVSPTSSMGIGPLPACLVRAKVFRVRTCPIPATSQVPTRWLPKAANGSELKGTGNDRELTSKLVYLGKLGGELRSTPFEASSQDMWGRLDQQPQTLRARD